MEITLDTLIRSVLERAEDPLRQLDVASETAAELDEMGDTLLNHFVDRCRRSGHTWAEIGEHLGVTRQAAQKRFVDTLADAISFERFTPRAREALEHSQTIATGMQHNYIGTEHLLIALYGVGGIAAQALERLGVQQEAVVNALTARVGRGAGPVTGNPPFTPRAKTALHETLAAAVELGHNYIGTEHLLLGLYRGQDGLAKQILEQLGAPYDTVRNLVIELLSGFKKT